MNKLLRVLFPVLVIALLVAAEGQAYAFEFDTTAIVERIKSENSIINVVLWCLLGGLLSCLTPCVYPLIPITLGIFGARQEESKLKAFLLSLSFVVGIAACFTALGLAAAASGTFFGSALSSPIVIAIISIILILLALYTLDLFSVAGIHQLQQAANKLGGSGHGGAFLMGCATGIIAAPCVGPVLLTILVIAASAADYFTSSAMLFSYALGLGIPFIILGTFSPLLSRIPRSGSWLSVVKYILATCIFGVAIFFAQGLFPKWLLSSISSSSLFAIGILLFCALAAVTALRNNRAYLRALSSAMLSLVIMAFILSPTSLQTQNLAGSVKLSWHSTIEAALTEARDNNTIAMVDLFAEWCAACKELDIHTFSKDSVKQRLSNISIAKIDFTDLDEQAEAITEKYSVLGLPCILFLKPDGSEIPDTRITGFMEEDEFLNHMETKVKL